MAVTTPAQYIWRVGDISSWSKYSPGEIHGMCRTAILISYSRACSSCRARSKPESWPSDGLPFGLTNHDDGEGEVAGFKGERPIVFTFLGERWGGGAGGRSFQRQDGRVRGAGGFTAHLDEVVEAGFGGGVRVGRERCQQGEIALWGHAGMGAIHGEQTEAEGVNAGWNHLAAAVGALVGEADEAEQGALSDAEGNGGFIRLGAHRQGFGQPDFAPGTRWAVHAESLGLNRGCVDRGQTGRGGGDGFQFVVLSEGRERNPEENKGAEDQAVDHVNPGAALDR